MEGEGKEHKHGCGDKKECVGQKHIRAKEAKNVVGDEVHVPADLEWQASHLGLTFLPILEDKD